MHSELSNLLVPSQLLVFQASGTTTLCERVVRARSIQLECFRSEKLYVNSQMSRRLIPPTLRDLRGRGKLLENAIVRLGLSARAHDGILKVSRNRHLGGAANIEPPHLGEAIQYRALDRTYLA